MDDLEGGLSDFGDVEGEEGMVVQLRFPAPNSMHAVPPPKTIVKTAARSGGGPPGCPSDVRT